MSESQILFSAPMVRAILDGRKTQTRRVIPDEWWRCLDPDDEDDRAQALTMCPYGAPGDRLWVRETWAWSGDTTVPEDERVARGDVWFRADPERTNPAIKWHPSIHMPRWASRITLEVTAVRVERLQAITEEDARAEGHSSEPNPACVNGEPGHVWYFDPRTWFAHLWNAINSKRAPWASNPWVWMVGFRRLPREEMAARKGEL